MIIYLIHSNKPIGNPDCKHGCAQHYIGSTGNLQKRLANHKCGHGSRLVAAMNAVGWQVVRTWAADDRELEKQLKRQKNARRFCPVCGGEK